jgi:hypothetical protein
MTKSPPASVLTAFKLDKTPEMKRCESPICAVEFEQTGMAIAPRRFCCPECRMDAWTIKRVAELLKQLSDAEALKILRLDKV